MKKVSNIKYRIKEFAEKTGENKDLFFEKLGTTSANFRGKKLDTGVNGDLIGKIVSLYPDINLHWLITGKTKYAEGEVQNTLNEPKADLEDYKAKYYACTEKYMQLNEELKALQHSNARLKKDNNPIYDKS